MDPFLKEAQFFQNAGADGIINSPAYQYNLNQMAQPSEYEKRATKFADFTGDDWRQMLLHLGAGMMSGKSLGDSIGKGAQGIGGMLMSRYAANSENAQKEKDRMADLQMQNLKMLQGDFDWNRGEKRRIAERDEDRKFRREENDRLYERGRADRIEDRQYSEGRDDYRYDRSRTDQLADRQHSESRQEEQQRIARQQAMKAAQAQQQAEERNRQLQLEDEMRKQKLKTLTDLMKPDNDYEKMPFQDALKLVEQMQEAIYGAPQQSAPAIQLPGQGANQLPLR